MLRVLHGTHEHHLWEIRAKIGEKLPLLGHSRAPNLGVRLDEAFFSSTWVQMLI